MNYILPFASPAATLAAAGGKGANLAELVRAGFLVPPGFIVGTDAYRAFVLANGLDQDIAAAIDAIDTADPAALEAASARIRARFAQAAMPDAVAAAIDAALKGLGPGARVAVRSSATAEDLPGLSFAGQQDTFLNILGPVAIKAATVQCWSSLWTARAIGYRARNRIPAGSLALAVVVQIMVDAEISGVMFTANPLSGHRGQIVIDATFGLGEALVSGLVTPDHFVIERATGIVTARKLGSKGLAIRGLPGGGTVQSAAPEAAGLATLDDAILTRLVSIGEKVEAHFGGPQDIEFAWVEGGGASLLQSRPITALYPLLDPPPAQDGPRLFLSFNGVQGIAAPFSPLGADVIQLILGGVIHRLSPAMDPAQFAPRAGGRLYVDLTYLLRDRFFRRIALAGLSRADPTARTVVVKLLADGRFVERPIAPRRRIARLLISLHHAPPLLIKTIRNPRAQISTGFAAARAYIDAARQRADTSSTLPATLGWMRSELQSLLLRMFGQVGPPILVGFGLLGLVDRWLTDWLGAPAGSSLALSRGVRNTTTEMNLKLWAASRAVAQGADRRGALGVFLAEYGARGNGELDIASPRWHDDPSALDQTLESYLRLDDPAAAPDAMVARGEAEAARLTVEYVDRARASHPLLGGLRARLLAGAIARARITMAVRETPKQLMVEVLDACRRALLRQGEILAATGVIERADDVFFLRLSDLDALASGSGHDLKPVVASVRAEHAAELARPRFPRALMSTGEAFYGAVDDGTLGPNTLAGDGVSPGLAEGVAHVIADPRAERLEPGEILVCVGTDPGWTPLFLAARALVTEVGGLVTHGSVVAREYGIPAVVGVDGATTRIRTGQRIRVDGTTGRVILLEDS